MKKKPIIILSLILTAVILLGSVISVMAETIFIYNGYSYNELNDGYISICGWDDRSEALVIPAQLDGSYIKEVGDRALKDDTVITSVDFTPAGYMTRIGIMAFQGCTALSGTVSIPFRITDVGYSAFQNCASIAGVEYYASTGNVPMQCFYNCSSLESVIISDGVDTIEKLAFANCPQLSYVRIPANVTTIASSAFNGDDNLVIYCYTDSYAHQYAEEKGYAYVLIDAPTEPETQAPETEAPTEPETQAPETELPTEPETEPHILGYYLGDMDTNETVEMIDATFVQRYLANMAYPDTCKPDYADVDGDEELSIVDTTLIQRHLAGLTVNYPVGEWIAFPT